jgi:bicarbonate transport system permease protein
MIPLSSSNRRNRSKSLDKFIENFLPPIIGIFSFLILWQIFSIIGLIKLPPPTSLWTDERTRNYLLYPFFDSRRY